jgi:Zn-dependent protease with chaperone function
VLAVLLAAPVPVLLRRVGWPWRDPLAALALWQAVGLAGGLSAIGCALYYGVSPLADTLPGGVGVLAGELLGGRWPAALGAGHLVALLLAAALAARLGGVLVLSFARTVRRRRRHRRMVELLAGSTSRVPGARLLDHPSPVAYCLPGGGGAMVLSAGLLDLLAPAELAAVVEHERTHLRQRHDLVLLPFAAWRTALPFLPTARMAHEAVVLLVEMLADDGAKRRCSAASVAAAIDAVLAAPAPDGALAVSAGETATLRARRLLEPRPALPLPLRVLVLGASLLLVAVPTVLLLAPAFG